MFNDLISRVGVIAIALVVVGGLVAYALLHPGAQADAIVVAMVGFAGTIVGYFFHASSQGFLGAQMANQNDALTQAFIVGAHTIVPSTNYSAEPLKTNTPTTPSGFGGSSTTIPTPPTPIAPGGIS